MDPTHVEQLKRTWTSRRVTVASTLPTLSRFKEQLGTVMTVNMNGRALVRFDGTADIGWYDIALSDLAAVAAPPAPVDLILPPPGEPPVTSATRPEGNAKHKPTVAQPAAKPLSVLELARRQGAAKN